MTENLKGISGSMFAGKTELLLKEITRAEYAGKKVQVFKPSIDDRWGKQSQIRSHSGGEHSACAVQNAVDILDCLDTDTQMVAIDEVQFFDEQIVDVVQFLLDMDIRVVFAGLSLDFRGEPFGSMPTLLALSDELERPTAICNQVVDGHICGSEATRTQRLINGQPANYHDPIVLIGAEQEYQARCPNHHQIPGKPVSKIKK
ncbi:MAG TPA: thymidine kinase [Patescibacteria group bacterium]